MLAALMPQQGPGGGIPGSAPQATSLSDFTAGGGAPAAEARRIAEWIQSRPGTNFSIGGLENYGGTGQVTSGHVQNSQHYGGYAGDVSYVGGKRFNGEPAALDWLYNRLQQKFGDDLTELIWRAPDHYDHLHYGTRPGG